MTRTEWPCPGAGIGRLRAFADRPVPRNTRAAAKPTGHVIAPAQHAGPTAVIDPGSSAVPTGHQPQARRGGVQPPARSGPERSPGP